MQRKKVTATQAKVRFGEILADVSVGKECVLVEKQGREIAAVIPMDDFRLLEKMKEADHRRTRHEILEDITAWRNSLPPPDPDAPNAAEILREIRDRDRSS